MKESSRFLCDGNEHSYRPKSVGIVSFVQFCYVVYKSFTILYPGCLSLTGPFER